MKSLRIATRKSPLALWQAEDVSTRLQALHPGLKVELVTFTTRGDKILDVPLAKVGGKGLFVKELEQAMLANEADIAVHSMKDVPMAFPDGLGLAVILARETPFDAFVSNHHRSLADLPTGAVVGTSSLRRAAQLLAHRPDLQIASLRGNVGSRLQKLDDGQFDAIVLAAAGLIRLGLGERIAHLLDETVSLPACGQGAVGIECRTDDHAVQALLAPLADAVTTRCVLAERAMNTRLDGGCQVPIAGYAIEHDGQLWLRGRVGSPDGKTLLHHEATAALDAAETLGIRVAEALLADGADRLLADVHANAIA